MTQPVVQARIFDLLRLAKTLRHYEEMFERASGDGFNVFNILHVGHYEVRTHSPLLAELLNPKGSHGQGALFLRRFLARFEIAPFDAESAQILKEYRIGPRTDDDGGRIDILIRDGSSRVVMIENKIYAGLQQNQLGRYREYASKGTLIFLTLNGDIPAEPPPNLRCISYRTDIVGWLQDCRKEAVNAPYVRETISQYIRLVQKLTQQNTSTRMNQELIKAVLHDQESFLAYTELCNAASDVRVEITKNLFEKLQGVAKEFDVQLAPPFGELWERYGGFDFSNARLQTNNIRIGFEFEETSFRGLIFGFNYVDPQKGSPIAQRIKELFKAEFDRVETTPAWPAWSWWEQYGHGADTILAAVQFGTFVDDLKELLKRLLKIADQACANS